MNRDPSTGVLLMLAGGAALIIMVAHYVGLWCEKRVALLRYCREARQSIERHLEPWRRSADYIEPERTVRG